MATRASSDDQRFCRRVLPRVSRTFALNIRLLGGRMGNAVRVAYLLCRAADALEDSCKGPAEAVARRFDWFRLALDGDADAAERLVRDVRPIARGRADLELVAHLPVVLRVYADLDATSRAALADLAHTMASGMRRYASRAAERAVDAPYLDTDDELRDYCFVVAGCVGVMLTRLAARDAPAGEAPEARRLALAPIVGEALQLTNILLDWPTDLRRGRCHLPASWLDEFGVCPADLVGRDTPAARALAARLETRARAALAHVPEYVDLFPRRMIRYRLFCLWPSLWAAGSLRHARLDREFPWGARRPKLPKAELWRTAIGSLLVAHTSRGLRGLYERELAAGAP